MCKRNLERKNRADVKPAEEGDRDKLLRKHGCAVKSVTGMDAPSDSVREGQVGADRHYHRWISFGKIGTDRVMRNREGGLDKGKGALKLRQTLIAKAELRCLLLIVLLAAGIRVVPHSEKN